MVTAAMGQHHTDTAMHLPPTATRPVPSLQLRGKLRDKLPAACCLLQHTYRRSWWAPAQQPCAHGLLRSFNVCVFSVLFNANAHWSCDRCTKHTCLPGSKADTSPPGRVEWDE